MLQLSREAAQRRPTLVEQSILHEHEPSANYEVVQPAGITQGRQSLVNVLQFKLNDGHERVMWKRMGFGKSLSQLEVDFLHSRLRPYRRSLRMFGWNVPKLYQTQSVEADGEWQIYSYEQYIPGGDAEYVVTSSDRPNYEKWQLLRTAVETLAEYPENFLRRSEVCGAHVTRLPHGLDLKLANLVRNRHMVYFVDIFGPKEIDANGNWVSYNSKLDSLPEENLIAMCATREGALLRLIRMAESGWLQSGSISADYLRSQLEDVLDQSGIPPRERDFILTEVDQDYPWLDALYSETRI